MYRVKSTFKDGRVIIKMSSIIHKLSTSQAILSVVLSIPSAYAVGRFITSCGHNDKSTTCDIGKVLTIASVNVFVLESYIAPLVYLVSGGK